MKRINCFKCVNFVVSYNIKMPYICKEFGFKGSQLPSITVFQTLKQNCPAFIEKPAKTLKK